MNKGENNKLVNSICLRQVSWSKLKIDHLRTLVCDNGYGGITKARKQCLGMTKGDIIRDLLLEEFIL